MLNLSVCALAHILKDTHFGTREGQDGPPSPEKHFKETHHSATLPRVRSDCNHKPLDCAWTPIPLSGSAPLFIGILLELTSESQLAWRSLKEARSVYELALLNHHRHR